MASVLRADLAELSSLAISGIDASERRTRNLVVAFFDLSGSTAAKVRLGHEVGTQEALIHNAIAKSLVLAFGGEVRKDLGDGMLAVFTNHIHAVLAGQNILAAVQKSAGLTSKVGLAAGLAEERKLGGRWDVLGATVDRAARIQSLARPGQMLVDEAFFLGAESFLRDYPELEAGPPEQRSVTGISTLRYHEIRTAATSPFVATGPVWIEELGRPSIEDKVRFLSTAREEVLEFGAGLTTLADYFHSQPAARFRDRLASLVSNGVTLRYALADPDSSDVQAYFAARGEPEYVDEIRGSITNLRAIAAGFSADRSGGGMELRAYAEAPEISCLAIDIGTNDPSANGRMMFSHYLSHVPRSEAPVIHLDAASNPTMFDKYWSSIRARWKAAKDIT
jgi:class 3 adenylate cyclase